MAAAASWTGRASYNGGVTSTGSGTATAAAHLQRMREILERDGMRAVLVYLNGLTEHRFTAMYRFDDETLRSTYFYDREFPDVGSCADIPVAASYCVFVRESGRAFATTDAPADARVDGHPKQLAVQSYCGVPLVDANGRMFGTICHFDPRPLELDDEAVALMEAVATLLPVEPAPLQNVSRPAGGVSRSD